MIVCALTKSHDCINYLIVAVWELQDTKVEWLTTRVGSYDEVPGQRFLCARLSGTLNRKRNLKWPATRANFQRLSATRREKNKIKDFSYVIIQMAISPQTSSGQVRPMHSRHSCRLVLNSELLSEGFGLDYNGAISIRHFKSLSLHEYENWNTRCDERRYKSRLSKDAMSSDRWVYYVLFIW